MTEFLVDANLPEQVLPLGQAKVSVPKKDGQPPSDTEIWTLARKNNWVVFTRDTDFFDRLSLLGPPPKVVWFWGGNMKRKAMVDLVQRKWPDVLKLLEDNDLIEIHSDRLETFQFSQSKERGPSD